MLRRRKPEPVHVVLEKEPRGRPWRTVIGAVLLAVVIGYLVVTVYSQTH